MSGKQDSILPGVATCMSEYRSFRQRVSSPTTSSPTCEVDSPTLNVSSPTLYMPGTSGPNVQNTFSFGLAVDERTRNKLYGAWMKERGITCMALSSGYTYLAVCLAPQWIKERGIIDMRVRDKVALYPVV